MDPLFGLPVIRDTRAMDTAKQRNNLQEKVLQQRLGDLENRCTSITSRINSDSRQLHQVLKDLHPKKDQDTGLVVPRGLSVKEQDSYRKLRRGSLPSMSLNEFDQKLGSLLKNRRNEREELLKMNSRHFNRRKSHMVIEQQSARESLENVKIVPLDVEMTGIKYSSIVKGALQRATSEEEQQSTANSNDNPRLLRSVSGGCTFQNRRSFMSGFGEDADDISSLPSSTKSSGANSPTLPEIRPGKPRDQNGARRATTPQGQHSYLLNRRCSMPAKLSTDAMLTKLEDIMETWRSAPAVKRSMSEEIL